MSETTNNQVELSVSAAGRHIAAAYRGTGREFGVVTKIWFPMQSIVEIQGAKYRLISSNDRAHIFQPLDAAGNDVGPSESMDHEELIALGDKVREHVDALRPEVEALKLLMPSVSIRDLPPKKRDTVLFRLFFCERYLRALDGGSVTKEDKSILEFIGTTHVEYVREETARQTADGRCGNKVTLRIAPSVSTLKRWLEKFEAFSFEPMALCDGYGKSGNSTARFELPERRILRTVAAGWASRLKPSKVQLLEDLKIAINEANTKRKAEGLAPLVCPGRKALANEIERLDPYHAYAAREGVDKARKRFQLVHMGLDVTFHLERIEMDESLVPMQVFLEEAGRWATMNDDERAAVERSRLWVSTALDARTRCFLALRLIRRLTGAEAVATLDMAVHDKTEFALAAGCKTPWDMMGRAIGINVDNGKSWISHEFKSAVIDLRAAYQFGPAGVPQMRGRKERAYRTINQGLISSFDGRTFENVVRKGEYDSEGLAQINEVELGHALVRWVVDVYHNRPHKGLGGETPRNCWLRLEKQFGRRLPPGRDERRHIFGTTLELNLGTDGVRVLGNLYNSIELQRHRPRLRGAKVLVRVSSSDLGVVSVRVGEGWITVPCMRSGMDGVSASHWTMAVEALARRFASEAAKTADVVLDAIRDIRELADATRLRAGISSPIMTADDYAKLEARLFRDFGTAEDSDGALEPIVGTASDDVTSVLGDAETTDLFDPDDADGDDTDDTDTAWTLED